MAKIAPNCTIKVILHYTDELVAIYSTPGRKPGDVLSERFHKRIGRLKNVSETCDSHQCWVEVDCQAKTWEGAQKEIARTDAIIRRIISKLND